MSLRKNIQYVFIANIITIVLGALVYPVVLNFYHLEAVEFGIYQKYTSALSLISSFIFFSLDTTYISENHTHNSNEKNYFFTLVLFIICIGTILSSIIIYIFKVKINIFYISFLVFLNNLFQLFIVLLKDEKELKRSSSILIQQNIINLLIIFILGYYFRTYKIFIYGMIASNIYGIIKLFTYIKISIQWNTLWIKKFIKNNFEKIFYQTITNIFQRNSQEIPILLFLKYFGENVVGFFNIGHKLLVLGNRVLSSALSQTFLSHMSKSKKEKEIILKNFDKLAVFFFCVYASVSLFSNYYLKFIVGENYLKVAEIIRILSPLLYLEALVSPYTSLFIIENKMKTFTSINIFFSIFRILLIYFLGKKVIFNNLLLIFVLIGGLRYLVLSFFITNSQIKSIIFCVFFILNLFLINVLYNVLFFRYYIIVITFLFLLKLFVEMRRNVKKYN